MNKKFYTYILLCKGNLLYCGYTDDVEKRFSKHLDGSASKFTRAFKPVKMLYTKEFDTKNDAMRHEYYIKTLTRKQKEELINES